MPSIANNKKSSSRRNTFGGEGIENAVNKKPARQSISGGDQQQQSSNKVRWNVPKTTSATSNNNLNTSISTNNMTPSKRVVDKFVNVASGKEKDVVRNYHFEGTPFASSKKKRRKHHGNNNNNNGHGQQNIADSGAQGVGGGEYTASLSAANAIDNSFQLNNDTTAEILKMATASNNTSIALDPLDESLLSAASSNSTASSSTVDPLTLSDTHELSTSNFIQNTKMRGILANRAKELYGNNNKDGGGDKGNKMDSVWEKPFGDNLAGKINNQEDAVGDNNKAEAVGERQISNSFSSLIDGVGLEASSTLTLPDLTMNVTGLLPASAVGEEQQERLQPNQEEEEDSEILEFTSHQKSRTPRKSPSRELSLLNNSASDDTTRSAGGLDSMLANFDDDEVEDGKQVASKEKREATITTDLSKLIEESTKMMADGEVGGVKRRSGEASFVESTASQGDLANLLNDDEEVEESGTEKNQESTPLATINNNTASTPNSSSGLCPSPSFLSGKKQRGSGIPTLRKSLGGDVTKIRKLTASLRKEKKSKKRMSLPALAMSKQQLPGGGRLSMDVMDNTEGMKEQEPPPKSLELANSPARNTRSAKKSPKKSPAVDSPARNTRGSAKKSPRKSPAGKLVLILLLNILSNPT